MVESILSMFHLRRVQFQAYVKEAKGCSSSEPINDAIEPNGIPAVRERSTMILLDTQTKIGRNPELVDVVLHSVVHSNMISRNHSEIIGEMDSKGNFVRYYISDRSLNGTYVNDTRVKENVLLNEGDLIKFGHVNGAAIKPGEHAPQHTAEFIFRFERALPKFIYFGYSQKGERVNQNHQNEQQRRAYMQINSDRILPTEVYASLVPSGGSSASAVGAATGPTVPRPIASAGCPAAVNSSANAATTTACSSSSAGAPPNCAAPSFPSLHTSSTNNATTSNTAVIPNCSTTTLANNGTQIAQMTAVPIATTLANTVATAAASNNNVTHQQQQRNQSNGSTTDTTTNTAALNALNQLGLTSATEEQVATVNAHLRQLMASHDAMSAMERLAAQQQWSNSLLKLSSLQQQNPLVYGHVFPTAAAAAATAALFSSCIDLNSGSQNTAAAQYAASLWPNIRALQPSVSQSSDWAQQQKAAAIAQQLQLRLPGLYQQQQQQQQAMSCVVQSRGASVSMPNVAPSLFGTPSAFSLPNTQLHNNNTNSSVTLPSTSSTGLLIAAQQQCVSTSSSSSAAYASCTSSASSTVGIPPLRPLGASPISSLSRGTSSVSLPLHQSQGNSVVDQQQQQNTAATLAARFAAAQQLAKLEADQQAKASTNAVPSAWTLGISCSSAAGTSVPVTKVSPVICPSNGSADAVVGGRIPEIASVLAAAVVAAQQQHQQNNSVPPWPSGTPPNNVSHPSLDTPPIRQPLAQRIFSPAVSTSSNLSMSSGSSKSSSGVSSAPSNGLLQSPNNSDVGKEFRDSFSSLLTTNSLSTSAFSSPQISNNTNLNTLTTAMFAAEREKTANATGRQRTKSMSANATEEKDVKTAEVNQQQQAEGEKRKEKTAAEKEALIHQKASLNCSSPSLSSDLQLDQQQMDTLENSKMSNFHDDNYEDLNKLDGTAQCEEKREQMECDSSVPSPPPIKEQREQLMNMAEKERNGEDSSKVHLEKVHVEQLSPQRKRHSSASSPSPAESIDEERDEKAERNKSGNQKPRPVKQARKSNEVARLLNDLTAGNCTDGLSKKGTGENENGTNRSNLKELDTEKDCKKKETNCEAENAHCQKHFGRDKKDRNESEDFLIEAKTVDESFQGKSQKTNKQIPFLKGFNGPNGSWQYMAERSQKLAAQNGKFGGRGDGNDSSAMTKGGRVEKAAKEFPLQMVKNERKRPLRLEERKKAEMERKRAHKMMRQISDESSDEEHNGPATTPGGTTKGRREGMAIGTTNNSSKNDGQQQQQQQKRHNDTNRKEIASPQLSSSDDEEDDNDRKSPDLESSDSDHHQQRSHHHTNNKKRKDSDDDTKREGNAQTKTMVNGGGTAAKRKLLSSAPGTKKAMALMNNVTTKTTNKLVNGGQQNSDEHKKRGPKKGRTEDKVKTVRSSKKLTANNPSAVAICTPLKKKTLGKKTGNGRGRPVGNAQKAVDRSSNSGDSSDDDDSSIDQPVRLTSEDRGAKLNGSESAMTKGTGRRGRHRGRKRDNSSPDLATTTVAEDWTGGNGDPELCAHKKCQRPIHMSINWVQCDNCDQWFHSTCVFGTNTTPKDDVDFHCGCAKHVKKTSAETIITNRKNMSSTSLSP